MKFRALLGALLALYLASIPLAAAFAHGDEPRLEISLERISPGGVVDVRGVDFEFEEIISLALIGPNYELSLGEVTADAEGVFLQTVALPTDLGEGNYQFRAITDDHEILSPTLAVQGSPIAGEEGGEPREDEDALLAPMPSSVPATLVPAAGPTANSAQPPSTGSPMVVLIGLIMVGAALAVGWRLVRPR